MRNYVMGLLVLACMLSRPAFADRFCDDNQRLLSPRGGGPCHQTRATASDGDVGPIYSDLAMTPYWGTPDDPIKFTLDIGLLFAGVSALDEQRIDVLELGLGQFSQIGSPAGNVSGEHTLLITVDRLPSGSWSLGYAWLAVPANWSIVDAKSMPAVEAGGESTLFTPNVTGIDVDITPSGGWQQLAISARPSGRVSRSESIPPTFDMPPVPAAARNLPIRLRTGVLGGDLRAGIETKYVFTAPDIAYGQ